MSTPTSDPTPISTQARARGRGAAWTLVMRREVLARITDKGFLISTVLTATLIAAYLAFVAWSSHRTDMATLAVTATDLPMAQAVASAAGDDLSVTVKKMPDASAARSALAESRADAWLHRTEQGWSLTFQSEKDSTLAGLTERVVAAEVVAQNAAEAGTDLSVLQHGSTLTTHLVDGDQDQADLANVVGFAFAFLFYLASILFGMQLASSVVEEKQNRIVEIIAAAIPLRHLLIGKILGNATLAVVQLLLYVTVGLVGLSLTDFSSFVPSLSGPVLWFLAFFTAGFIALSCLWAVAGALASRNEDLQSTTMPLTMTLVFVFVVALSVDGSTERVLSFVPPFSAILMPKRLLADAPPVWEPLVAIVLLLAAAGALVLLGERLYRRALLQTSGKVSLKQAWRTQE